MLQCVLENTTNRMPHKMTIFPSDDVVVLKLLPSSFKWKDALPNVNSFNKTLELQEISITSLSRIWRISFLEYKKKRHEDNFAQCGE
jgi:hypothetical protein